MSRGSYTRIADGATVTDSEAIDARGCLKPGYSMHFSMHLLDSAHAVATPLRDAAGQPVTLHDAATGQRLTLNADLIAAIEAEAAKLGMSVADYVGHVLKYSWAGAKLSGNATPGTPAMEQSK